MCYATLAFIRSWVVALFFIEVHLKFITVQVDVTTVLRCLDRSLSKGAKGGKGGGRT